MHRGPIVLALLFLAGVANAQPTPRTAFAFVLLGEGADGAPVPMVRTVVEGAESCHDRGRARRLDERLARHDRRDLGDLRFALARSSRRTIRLCPEMS